MILLTQLCLSVLPSIRVASRPMNMILTIVPTFQFVLNWASHAEQRASRRCLRKQIAKIYQKENFIQQVFVSSALFREACCSRDR